LGLKTAYLQQKCGDFFFIILIRKDLLAEDRRSWTYPRLLAASTGFDVLAPHRKRRSSFWKLMRTLAQKLERFK